MPTPIVIALTTCPDEPTATRIADALVGEELAACVNQLLGMRSTYRWQGKIQRDSEVLLVIKTLASQVEAVERRVIALHPYELPEFVVLPVSTGSVRYLDWIRQNVLQR
jgi:periplasmic divalent cation tolerance protein